MLNVGTKFLFVGLFNSILAYGVIFFCMYKLNYNPVGSNITGYAIGLFFSYFLNRKFTFKSQGKKIPEITNFLLCFFISYGVSLCLLQVLISVALNPGISQLLSGAGYVLTSFVLNKWVVFKR